MRLIVADTNVLVSAAINGAGAPGILVMDWILEGQVQVVTCPAVVREYREVMRRSKFTRYRLPPLWLEFLVEESLRLDDPPAWPFAGPDRDDLIFLALARASGAWLVTGNLRHFPERQRHGVTVVSPAGYLARLQVPS
ncbi:MAG: putative toxin-antitoxin system toxin component, PIN family [Acidobacteriota bacterium]